MIKRIGLIFMLFVSVLTFAQPQKASVETVDGKKYYVHFIEKGQTLYGIHQMYNVPVGDIARANNNLEGGLQIGQKILIPISVDDTKFYGQHIVVKGETLYGISKKYKCSVSDLKKINQELLNEGVSIGQVIKVPNLGTEKIKPFQKANGEVLVRDPEVAFEITKPVQISNDSIITHTVLAHETLYSISKRYMVSVNDIRKLNEVSNNSVKTGDQLKIKVKKVNYTIVEKQLEDVDTSLLFKSEGKKDKYKVALFLPLMLSKNQSYMDKPMRVGKVKELFSLTEISSEFYHGFILAADSLTKAGLNVEIYVYDTKKDTLKIESSLKEIESSEIDLIIGGLFPKTINYLAKYCKAHQIPMVIPFKANSKVLDNNPYVYKVTVSNLGLVEGISDYVVKEMNHYNVLIVEPTKKSDLVLFEKAKDKYNTEILLIESPMTPKIIELKMGNANGRDINLKLRKDTVNIIIVPSTDVKFVTSVFTRLNSVMNLNAYSKGMRVIVFGLEDWNKMNDIDLKHRMRLNQHFASYRFLDYSAPKTNNFIGVYRSKYGTDPQVFGVQGFDVGYYFLSALHLYGPGFTNNLHNYKVETIQNDFSFPKNNHKIGVENESIKIIEYRDYELKLK